jgi:hypothetical protein
MVELERDRLERGRRKYSLNNAEFKELDHPRGEDGKFGSGGKLGEKEEKQKKEMSFSEHEQSLKDKYGEGYLGKITEEEKNKRIELWQKGNKKAKKGLPTRNVKQISPKMAKEYYDSNIIPDGWFVHGRSGRQDLNTGHVVQFSKDWGVADQYAGKSGSKWMASPKNEADVFDATDQEETSKTASMLIKDFEEDSKLLSPNVKNIIKNLLSNTSREDAISQIANEMNPSNIVDSAGFWDAEESSLMNWFYDRTGKGFIITKNGAVAIDPGTINATKVE